MKQQLNDEIRNIKEQHREEIKELKQQLLNDFRQLLSEQNAQFLHSIARSAFTQYSCGSSNFIG